MLLSLMLAGGRCGNGCLQFSSEGQLPGSPAASRAGTDVSPVRSLLHPHPSCQHQHHLQHVHVWARRCCQHQYRRPGFWIQRFCGGSAAGA